MFLLTLPLTVPPSELNQLLRGLAREPGQRAGEHEGFALERAGFSRLLPRLFHAHAGPAEFFQNVQIPLLAEELDHAFGDGGADALDRRKHVRPTPASDFSMDPKASARMDATFDPTYRMPSPKISRSSGRFLLFRDRTASGSARFSRPCGPGPRVSFRPESRDPRNPPRSCVR